MSMAFDYSEDWIPLTSVQMARSRRDIYGGSGTIRYPRTDVYRNYDPYRHQRTPNWGLIFIAAVIFLLALFGYLFFNGLQAYTPFTGNDKVAQVTALRSREGEHQMSIWLTRFDANGHPETDKNPYLIQGDKLQLQYEYIKLPSWLGFIGLHSGYILTGLQGYYANNTLGTFLPLNKADEDNSVPAQIDAHLATHSYITLMPGRSIYTVSISQAGQLYKS